MSCFGVILNSWQGNCQKNALVTEKKANTNQDKGIPHAESKPFYKVVKILAHRGLVVTVRQVNLGEKHYFEYFFTFEHELYSGFIEVKSEDYVTNAPWTRERLEKRILAMAKIDKKGTIEIDKETLIDDYQRLISITDKYRKGKQFSKEQVAKCIGVMYSAAVQSIDALINKKAKVVPLSTADEDEIANMNKDKK